MATDPTEHLLLLLLRLTKRLHVKALVLDNVRSAILHMSPHERQHLTAAQFDEIETQAHESAFQLADKEASELEHALAHDHDVQKALHRYVERQK